MIDWVKASDRMPESGCEVLACYRNRMGKWRRIRARWILAKTEEVNSEDDIWEYDEAADTYYTPQGWYECIDNWDEYSSVAVYEGNVTHWTPLPEPPNE